VALACNKNTPAQGSEREVGRAGGKGKIARSHIEAFDQMALSDGQHFEVPRPRRRSLVCVEKFILISARKIKLAISEQ